MRQPTCLRKTASTLIDNASCLQKERPSGLLAFFICTNPRGVSESGCEADVATGVLGVRALEASNTLLANLYLPMLRLDTAEPGSGALQVGSCDGQTVCQIETWLVAEVVCRPRPANSRPPWARRRAACRARRS